MNRDPVASSSVATLGYDEATQTLEVEFANGAIYQYYNVGAEVYANLLSSPSKGQFIAYQIKSVFPYGKVG